jgi:hypothetical protein
LTALNFKAQRIHGLLSAVEASELMDLNGQNLGVF